MLYIVSPTASPWALWIDAYKEVPFCTAFDKAITDCYSIVSRSTEKTAELKKLQIATGEKILSAKALHATRWLGRVRCVEQIHHCLVSWATLFDTMKDKHVLANQLHQIFTSYQFIVMTSYFRDVLSQVAALNCLFQQDSVPFDTVLPAVERTKSVLKSWYSLEAPGAGTNGSPRVLEAERELSAAPYQYKGKLQVTFTPTHEYADTDDSSDSDSSSEGSENSGSQGNLKEYLKQQERDIKYCKRECRAIMEEHTACTLAALDSRFPNLHLVDAFQIFSPKFYKLHTSQVPTLEESACIETLMGHYATAKVAGDGTLHLPRIDREAFTDEFPRFKALMVHLILSKKLDPEKCEFKEFCQYHVSELLSLPTVLFLIQIALILPMNSVPCERGFSKMKLINCKGRSRLDTLTLDWLMNISINAPPLDAFMKEFGVKCAIKFTVMKARRNGFSARFAAAIEKLGREEEEDDGDDEPV